MQVKEKEKYSWQTVEIKRRRIIGQSDRIERWRVRLKTASATNRLSKPHHTLQSPIQDREIPKIQNTKMSLHYNPNNIEWRHKLWNHFMLILIITQNYMYVFGRTFCFCLCINYNCICLFWFFAFDKVVAIIFLSKWCSRTAVLDNKWVCLAGMGGYNAHWQDAFVSETNTQHSNTATSSSRTLQFVFVHNFLLHLFVSLFVSVEKLELILPLHNTGTSSWRTMHGEIWCICSLSLLHLCVFHNLYLSKNVK